ERLAPQSAVDQIVPLGDEVVDRAARSHAFEEGAGVAEGDAAVHAAGALLAQHHRVGVLVELVPVVDALRRRRHHGQLPLVFHESGRLPHHRPCLLCRTLCSKASCRRGETARHAPGVLLDPPPSPSLPTLRLPWTVLVLLNMWLPARDPEL